MTVQPTRVRPPSPDAEAPPASPARGDRPAPRESAPVRDSHQSVLAIEPTPEQRTVVHVLRFQRAGHEISLDVALDDRVHCDFKVDTGASLNTIPRWAVKELGIEIDADTPTISLVGISGKPTRVPLVMIPSVRIGTVYVENVEMAVLDTMSSGLLGMPFFNHFQVSDRSRRGRAAPDRDRPRQGGRACTAAWARTPGASASRSSTSSSALIQKARESCPSESETTVAELPRAARSRRGEGAAASSTTLEDRAQAAGVPSSWR